MGFTSRYFETNPSSLATASASNTLAFSTSPSNPSPRASEVHWTSSQSNVPRPYLRDFGSEEVVDAVLHDYLEKIYPSIPVVHLPTFAADRLAARHRHDDVHLAFIFSLCAVVISILPRKFDEYCLIDPTLSRFTASIDAVAHLNALVLGLRRGDHYDNFSYEKWAISYLTAASHGYLGRINKSRVALSEAGAILLSMGFHLKAFYDGLDNIQAQLHKKAFWLMFTSYA